MSLDDALTEAAIGPHLSTCLLGRPLICLPATQSTNAVVREQAHSGAPEGLVVIADAQTGGRGRLGRSWLSPPGVGIWMSILLRPGLPAADAQRLTLAAAVAVADAIAAVSGLQAGIKWPNDVMIAGRKCSGILTEVETGGDRVTAAVVGIGINVNTPSFAPDLTAATSLLIERGGRPVARAPLAAAVLLRFEQAYRQLLAGEFRPVLDRWRALSVTLGRRVQVMPVGDQPYAGWAEAADDDGALRVRLDSGEVRRVLAGDVSIRSAE